MANPPKDWSYDKYKTQIEATKQHATGHRADDPANGHYCYWNKREQGKEPQGRKVGAKRSKDFGAAGETVKVDATMIIKEAEGKVGKLEDEVSQLNDLIETKDALIKKMHAQLKGARAEAQMREQHGQIYSAKTSSALSVLTKFYVMACKCDSKMSPMKLDEVSSYEESYAAYVQQQQQQTAAPATLDFEEDGMDDDTAE